MLHYHPDLDIRELDRHFPEIFPYAWIEGEIFPEIVVKETFAVEAAVETTPPGETEAAIETAPPGETESIVPSRDAPTPAANEPLP